MGEVIEFGYRHKVTKSWEALEPYRKFLAGEEKDDLLTRANSSDKELREPTLLNWQMKLCIYNQLLTRADTP